jgi:hypothetical protein
VGQAARRLVATALEPEQLEQPRRTPTRLARPSARAERGHLDVLPHRELCERPTVLKRTREPNAAAAVRAPRRDVASLELHRSCRGKVEAAEHVDERRLARAVRPDQAHDLVAVQFDRDAPKRVDALERS